MYLQNCDLFMLTAEKILHPRIFSEIQKAAEAHDCAKAAIYALITGRYAKRISPGHRRLLVSLLDKTTDFFEYMMLEKFGKNFNPQAAWEDHKRFADGWEKRSLYASFTCRVCGSEFSEQRHLVEDPVCDDCLPGEFKKILEEMEVK